MVFSLFMLSFAGIPLTSGFIGKWAVFAAAWSGGAEWLVVVAVVISVVAAFFYIRVIVLMFFSEPSEVAPAAEAVRPGWTTLAVVGVGVVATVAFGVFPGPLLDLAQQASEFIPLSADRARRSARMARTEEQCADQTRDRSFAAAYVPSSSWSRTALLAAAEADTPMVTEAAQHIIAAGGKRFRPLLVVLGSQIGPYAEPDDVVKAAVVVELTHVGSLYHDDVMDEASLRRGSDSANARWGNTVAILVGDLLFARASDTVAELGPEFVRLQARTFSRLVQGQIAETVGPADGQDPLDHYLQVVADKTGSLIATSALFGAKLSGASSEVQQVMAEFGEQIGVVFQLSDDIIDITSDVDRQDPGHRPSGGHPDSADAAGP